MIMSKIYLEDLVLSKSICVLKKSEMLLQELLSTEGMPKFYHAPGWRQASSYNINKVCGNGEVQLSMFIKRKFCFFQNDYEILILS